MIYCHSAHLAQHPATGRPPEALTEAVKKPQGREDSNSGGPGEEHVDASHHEQANGEEPAGADLVRKHAADELTDSVGQRLTAGDHAWTQGGQRAGFLVLHILDIKNDM